MIYVKQFVVQDVQKCKNYTSEENMAVPEVKKLHVLKCKKDTSRSEEITCLEVKKIHTNKNNINNTDLNNTESNLILSGNDGMGSDVEAYTELIRDNLDLDILRERYPYDQELLDGGSSFLWFTECDNSAFFALPSLVYDDFPIIIITFAVANE